MKRRMNVKLESVKLEDKQGEKAHKQNWQILAKPSKPWQMKQILAKQILPKQIWQIKQIAI